MKKLDDITIRKYLHQKLLNKYHTSPDILVIDELGLNHGSFRADIAVVEKNILGFEIKSEKDSLKRLNKQIEAYNSVFEYSTIVVSENHFPKVVEYIPEWWGVVICILNKREEIDFKYIKKPKENPKLDIIALSQLLWKKEVIEILNQFRISNKLYRKPRSKLYELLSEVLSKNDLKLKISYYLRSRNDWRYPQLSSRCDD